MIIRETGQIFSDRGNRFPYAKFLNLMAMIPVIGAVPLKEILQWHVP